MTKKKSSCGSEVAEKKGKYDDLKELSAKQKPLPDIYVVPPKQPKDNKVGQLTDEQLKQFFENVSFVYFFLSFNTVTVKL